MSERAHLDDADRALRQALAALGVDDVLALCYRFRTRTDRLRLYLDVLRQRAGPRAALASSLICFDLARQGHATAQREFEALAATLRAFEARAAAALELVAGSPYLEELWPACEAALRGLDPRLDVDAALVADAVPIEIELFAEDELEDLEAFIIEDFDVAAMRHQYDLLVSHFFYPGPDAPAHESRGFYAATRADIDRIEEFLRQLLSLHEFVPQARSMLAIGALFLATHLRTRSFWGRPNARRMELVASGLRHFMAADESLFEAVAYLSGNDAEPDAWPKIAQLVLDFYAWSLREWRAPLEEAPPFYAEEGRELPPPDTADRRAGAREAGRRRFAFWRRDV